MNGILYKLKEGWVLCSDEVIKEGELHVNLATLEVENASKNLSINILSQNSFGDSVRKQYKKVLTKSPDFSELKEEDAKTIGWFDVNKYVSFLDTPESLDQYSYDMGVVHGFQKAQELLSDRRFTEEDLLKAISLAKVAKTSDGLINMDNWISNGYEGAESAYSNKEIIQSISQPKSWEVEYELIDGVFKIVKIIK